LCRVLASQSRIRKRTTMTRALPGRHGARLGGVAGRPLRTAGAAPQPRIWGCQPGFRGRECRCSGASVEMLDDRGACR
jgi:hypothetical protein